MRSLSKLVRPFLFVMMFVPFATSCGGGGYYAGFYPYDYDYDWDWWDDDYDWWDEPWGGYTVVSRPSYVVDGWTGRAFRHPPYRGYRVVRHNSPVIEYTATSGDRTLHVNLKPKGDNTVVEVRARRGSDKWDKRAARVLASSILREGQ